MFFEKYPYTDFHELNLDWLLAKMKELDIKFDEFKVVNNITFSGQWDITKQYPAWTIVSDNNIGYVSQRPVPAGIPLSNGNYWVEVIDYTAQIAGLQNRVIALENEDIVINGRINNTNARIDALTLPDKYLWLGDSYAGIKVSDQNYADIAMSYIGTTNYTQFNYPGRGFTDINGMGKFIDSLQQITTDRDKYTHIIVCGGCNDYDTPNNIATAIKEFCDYAKANFPNAQVYIAHLGGFSLTTERRRVMTTSLPAYRACGKYGAIYIKNSEYLMYSNAVFESDGIHPVSSMITVFGDKLADGIKNNVDIEIITASTPTAESTANYTVSNIEQVQAFIHNNRVGFKGTSYRLCTISNITSGAYAGTTFEHKIMSNVVTYGFGTNWTTGLMAMPVRCRCVTGSVTEEATGILYMGNDNSLSLSVNPGTQASYIEVMFTTICDCEFDLTRL